MAVNAIGLWAIAARTPDRTAVIEPDGRVVTYAELAREADRYARGLRALGLSTGDAVAALLPNSATMLAVYFAAIETGLYVVPINWHQVAAEVAYILGDSGAGAFVAHQRFAGVAAEAAELAGIKHRFAVGGNEPMRFLAIGRLPQSGFAFFTDLADFQGFLDPFQAVWTVIEPGERLDPGEFFAFECLACRIKRKPAQQNLIGLSKGLHPGTSIDLQAVEILGFAGALMFFDPDFTDMDPDPVEHRPPNLSRECPQPSLDQKRKLHRVRGFGEDNEERVAGGFNFLAFAELG